MKKDFGVKTWLYPMPVLMIASYGEDGTPDVMNAAWGTMIDSDVVALNLSETHKTVQNIKARGAFTVAVTTEKQAHAFQDSDLVITVPDVHDWFTCSLTVVPMQLLSYYTAKNRGCDIDKPKNLAKSVTVE